MWTMEQQRLAYRATAALEKLADAAERIASELEKANGTAKRSTDQTTAESETK